MRSRNITSTMLWAGVVVPVLYFGAQLVRGPFVEGYSFRRNAASDDLTQEDRSWANEEKKVEDED